MADEQKYCYLLIKTETDLIHVKCPYCGEIEELEYYDYVDRPMIWCWGDCEARCILNMPLEYANYFLDGIGNIKYADPADKILFKLFHDSVLVNDPPFEYDKEKYDRCYKIELLFIRRIVTSELAEYAAKQQIPEENVRELVENKYEQSLIDKFNIMKVDEKNKDDFNVSINCNSYNISRPENPYPQNIDLGHDGIYMFCEVVYNGEQYYYKYWGD